MKHLLASVAVLGMLLTGPALAQNSGTNITSDAERQMMSDNPGMAGFFTDDTMTTLRSEDEIRAMYGEMSDEDKSRFRAACEADGMNETTFSRGTVSLCAMVRAM